MPETTDPNATPTTPVDPSAPTGKPGVVNFQNAKSKLWIYIVAGLVAAGVIGAIIQHLR